MSNVCDEGKIRDDLALRLHLLEPGLSLQQVETRIVNPKGASGRIDVLARDVSGNLVVIEIKRADQSARQAIHELFKYVRLLRDQHGVPLHRIRCFVVSTVWHELLGPFSELCRLGDFDVRGFDISVTDAGVITSLNRVTPLCDEKEPLEFDKEQDWFFFRTSAERKAFEDKLSLGLANYPFADFVFLRIDHSGKRTGVFPFGIYLAISELKPEQEGLVLASISETHPINEPEARLDPWTLADIVMFDIAHSLRGLYADWEKGTPERFAEVLNNWSIVATVRAGARVANAAVYTDLEIHHKIAKIDGKSRTSFHFIGSPRHEHSWKAAMLRLSRFLENTQAWHNEIVACIHEIEGLNFEAVLSLNIFSFFNVWQLLHPSLRSDSHQPFFELTVDCGGSTRLICGLLEWSGEAVGSDALDSLPGLFGPTSSVAHLASLRTHGLCPVLFEVAEGPPLTFQRIRVQDGAIRFDSIPGRPLLIQDFIASNVEYIEKLVARHPPVVVLGKRL